MVVFNDMSENVIKSEDVAPEIVETSPKQVEKTSKPVAAKEKVNKDTKVDTSEKPKKTTSKKVAKAGAGKKFVYFESGSAYVTQSGFRFTKQNRIYELDIEEADHLLGLDNFRLPNQLELEDYYKENN